MESKWIGAVLIIGSCGGFGISLGIQYRRRERMLYQLTGILDYMEAELQYKLTPLPELSRLAAQNAGRTLKGFFYSFAELLETRIAPDASSCMRQALADCAIRHSGIRRILAELGMTLGKFDLNGQIQGIRRVQQLCWNELRQLQSQKDQRIRCYQTLGFCTGLALVILFI